MDTIPIFTPKQVGENGHIEYKWSSDIKEQILQFNFQLVRTNDIGVLKLENILNSILIRLYSIYECSSCSSNKEEFRLYLTILYCMIGQTRDIIEGKGEYQLTYMMIVVWYQYYPELAKFALTCLVDMGNKHPYGSWKDIKYFCKYCLKKGLTQDHALIKHAVSLVNTQLRKDVNSETPYISLVSKWIPRENSSFSWLFELLALDYFSEYLVTTTYTTNQRARRKCKTNYRKLISILNKKLNTVQIKQCANTWSSIDFTNVTSITMTKQKKSFLNTNLNRKYLGDYNIDDRNECAHNFNQYIQDGLLGKTTIRGKRIGMEMFTKEALYLISESNKHKNKISLQEDGKSDGKSDGKNGTLQAEIDLLNLQWKDSSSKLINLKNCIAMVDVSDSMYGEPLYVASALGIRIAENSTMGKRVITFSHNPKWIHLEPYEDFVSMTEQVCGSSKGLNANLYAAIDLILTAIIDSKLSPELVEDMVLIILSDMQIHTLDYSNNTIYEEIHKKYKETGISLYGKPFKPPHILLWNLKSTNGFPCLSYNKNVSMISGYNPGVLDMFCDKGIKAFDTCTPWVVLEKSLIRNNRYKIMKDKLDEWLHYNG